MPLPLETVWRVKMSDHSDGILHGFAAWSGEMAAAILLGVAGWVGWLFRRYSKDRVSLETIVAERSEFYSKFGQGLIGQIMDIEDALEMLEEGQSRCESIHDGLAKNETSLGIIAKLEAKITATDQRLTQHILDEIEVRRKINDKLDLIIEELRK